jgi:GntP family gluconate:H+ symporter
MQTLPVATPQQVVSYWPFAVLVITMALVIFLITVVRVHAFLALILAAIVAGLLAGRLPGEPGASHWVQAVELTTTEFGVTAGKIAVVIALASVIGMCLMESGAADKVVRRFLAVFGEKRAGFALFTSSYILSIPIFFDTFFMLLLPIARALAIRTGKDYLLFVMAICCAGVVTHGVVAPHPGPLAMAETLKIDLGLTIIAGIVVGIIPAVCSWWVARWINQRMPVPARETPGTTMAELQEILARREEALPSFTWAILPVMLPIALISAASFLAAFGARTRFPLIYPWVEFWGNRNIALLIGAVIAMGVLARQKGYSVARICELIGPPFQTAGVIILITSAGGAFGLMLKNAGVGDAIKAAAAGHAVNLILLAYVVASLIRIAQGSATVAMLTTSAIMVPILQGGSALPYHSIYLFLAIGFGATILSWMNDSGFWVVSKLAGLTEKETLKSWTVISTVVSVVGLIATLIGAAIFPFAPK